MAVDLTENLSGNIEGAVTRDDDPSDPMTSTVASASLAWQRGENTQFDIGLVKGVRHAADFELYVGVSRRF